MEVILLEDVKSVGKKQEIVTVSEAYGRNCLIKKKLGIEATPENLNNLRLRKKNEDKLAQERLDEAKKLAEEMKEMSVVLKIKAGEGGRTFGSISTKEISKAVKEQLNLEIDKKKLVLDEPIRTLGTHVISVKLHKDVTAKLAVKVQEA
ncbi:MAG: 50S ribosomal protein L9 [Lachnospiraceae bacterium]|nr:50S ribosomal protein L9 [Lachnospiraceae bacterium]